MGVHPLSQRRPRSWQETREQEMRWLIERTGAGLEVWNARVARKDPADETALRAWLSTHGVTGYPQLLAGDGALRLPVRRLHLKPAVRHLSEV